MTNKVYFFYTNGTSSVGPFGLLNVLTTAFQSVFTPAALTAGPTVAGLNGRTARWVGGSPQNDPFPALLDPDVFTAQKVAYPAAMFPMNASIDTGATSVIAAINAMPAGAKFMLGGYSQGAAVMSTVLNQIRSGSLTSKQSQFLGGVMFGNPRRQVNYRGSVGGTWSGYWDDPNKNLPNAATTGGGGSFPATGNYARLTNCDPLTWIEFNEIDDVFSSVSSLTTTGTNWIAGNDAISGLNAMSIAAYLSTGMLQPMIAAFNAAQALGNTVNTFTDAAGKTFPQPGAGHTAYPWRPPPGNPDNGLTSYQIALKFLAAKAAEYAVAPIVVPPTAAGWSTTLTPPAAA